MGGIIFQVVVIIFLVGLLFYVAIDDRRTRALREREDAEEQRQSPRSRIEQKPGQDRTD